jgi:hypothetical protein
VRKHIKPGTVLGLIAVVFAMTGSAFAAQSLITSKDIKDGTIKSRDLSGAVKDKLNKVGKTGKTGPAGTNGATGPQGAAGAKGDTGPAGAPGKDGKDGKDGPFTYVNDLTGAFAATNDSVSITPDGVEFGPYADGGAANGSVCYSGADDLKLGDIEKLLYTASYSSATDTGGVAVPYLRVFLADKGTATMADDDRVIFSPNTQTDPETAEDVFHQWDVTGGVVRYNDYGGEGGDYGLSGAPWAEVVEDHGDEEISRICVSVGFTAGQNLTGMLRTLWVNDDVFRIAQF